MEETRAHRAGSRTHTYSLFLASPLQPPTAPDSWCELSSCGNIYSLPWATCLSLSPVVGLASCIPSPSGNLQITVQGGVQCSRVGPWPWSDCPFAWLGLLLASPKSHGSAIFHSDEQQCQNVFQLDKTQHLGAERDTSISSLKITLSPPGTQKQFRADTPNKSKVRRLRPTAVWLNGW
jgi:hypothetical protein